MKLKLEKQLGFTLIEQLVALGVLMLSLSLLLMSLQMIKKVDQSLRIPDALEWHLTMVQLQELTMGTHFKATNQKLMIGHLEDNYNEEYEVKKGNNKEKKIVYLSKEGGYQPLLIDYQQFMITRKEDYLELKGTLAHQHQFQVDFSPAVRCSVLSVKQKEQQETMANE